MQIILSQLNLFLNEFVLHKIARIVVLQGMMGGSFLFLSRAKHWQNRNKTP